MSKKLCICLFMFLILPGLLLTTACAPKKEVLIDDAQRRIEMERMKKEELARKEAEERRKQALEDAAKRDRERDSLRTSREEEERLKRERLRREVEQQRIMNERARFEDELIFFKYDEDDLTYEAREILKSKAEWLRKNPGVNILIEGHCDERGNDEYNQALGERRAERAKTFLIDMGIPYNYIKTMSWGKEKPLIVGPGEDSWSKNRRAKFNVVE
ncbi:Peptidoglycan-associated protein [Candidatus Magnetomoraceae bacterium gMMP-1]